MKFINQSSLLFAVNLVDGKEKRFAAPQHESSEFKVRPSQLASPIHDHHYGVSVFQRNFCLPENLRWNQIFVFRNNAACIHNSQPVSAPIGFTIKAIASNTGLIAHDCPPGAYDPVK